jgi:hypothetical protein
MDKSQRREVDKKYRDRRQAAYTVQEQLLTQLDTLEAKVTSLEEQLERFYCVRKLSDEELHDAREYISNR